MSHIQQGEDGQYSVQFSLGRFDYDGQFDGTELRIRTYDDAVKMYVEIVARQSDDTEQRYSEFYTSMARVIADHITTKRKDLPH